MEPVFITLRDYEDDTPVVLRADLIGSVRQLPAAHGDDGNYKQRTCVDLVHISDSCLVRESAAEVCLLMQRALGLPDRKGVFGCRE